MYCSYSKDDVLALFESFRSKRPSREDALIDFFGSVILPECAPYLATWAGRKLDTPPYPDDSFRATFVEYIALLDSIKFASHDSYQMCELGASYAPFTALAGHLALLAGIERIVLRPVEAAKRGLAAIEANLTANGLSHNPRVDVEIINAAISSSFGQLFFPDIDCTVDNGRTASDNNTSADVIHGAPIPHVAVDGVPLDFVLNKFNPNKVIDLLHVDIQGSEQTAIPDSIGLINTRVKRMLIGTHSRIIEAELLTILHRNGWHLNAEEPVEFKYRADLKNFVGMTIKDGSQYWVNSRLNN